MIGKTHSEIGKCSQDLKKNMIILSKKLDLEIGEDIGPLIDHLLKQGLVKNQEMNQFKKLGGLG